MVVTIKIFKNNFITKFNEIKCILNHFTAKIKLITISYWVFLSILNGEKRLQAFGLEIHNLYITVGSFYTSNTTNSVKKN